MRRACAVKGRASGVQADCPGRPTAGGQPLVQRISGRVWRQVPQPGARGRRARARGGRVHRDGVRDLITIGELAARTRLSRKALRLYGDRGLLPPVRVDPVTGFRYYGPDQVECARRIALLRAGGGGRGAFGRPRCTPGSRAP
ncbi:MerR family transcriptional regulator [Streptomyces sp. NPDC046197]|uniref:MerR family transcriptional regulator n=1 Tax=Streptomyces sp. NPDC046197 TaxID=3154337 RepID=UPI0033D13200